MRACPAFDPSGPFVGNVLSWFDCRALSFGTNGYSALGPNSAYGTAWTGLLIILVAFFGYRLLFSGTFVLRDATIMMVKIGAVLALAGQWPAYRTLVFNVFTSSPSELTGNLLGRQGSAPVGNYSLAYRVDRVSYSIADLMPPAPSAVPVANDGEQAPAQPSVPGAIAEQDKSKLEWASALLSISTLGGLCPLG